MVYKKHNTITKLSDIKNQSYNRRIRVYRKKLIYINYFLGSIGTYVLMII